MAISIGGGITLLPFAERPPYGTPYPEGLAVGHIDQVGDASGGNITATFTSGGGVLFRLEAFNATKGDTTTDEMNYQTVHSVLTERSGLGASSFNLDWFAARFNANAFNQFSPQAVDFAMLRRIPIGRTNAVTAQIIWTTFIDNNDTTIYDFDVAFSYWRVKALFQPGFLSAFFETPIVEAPTSRLAT